MKAMGTQLCIKQYAELMSIVDIQSENFDECITGFHDFVLRMDSMRLQFLEAVKRIKELEGQLSVKTKDNQHLENKLQIARRLHDTSLSKRKKIEEEKMSLEIQLQQVRDLLFGDARNKIHDETREKLQFLSSSILSRTSLDRMDYDAGGDRLTTIDEFESTGDMLSDLSCSRSEDDLDHVLETGMKARKCKRSIAPEHAVSAKRRSFGKRSFLTLDASPGECLVTTTRVTVRDGGMPVSASTMIRAFNSPPNTVVAPQSVTVPSAPKEDSDINFTPPQSRTGEGRGYLYTTPSSTNFFNFQTNSIHSRTHNLIQKNIIKPENCDPCGKKIRFGKCALKCLECRTICHPECKDQLSLPCIPPGSTTTPKGTTQLMNIADYAPPTCPMIPALVVHCVNEVEKRGPQEVGIYRIPGQTREAKALKQRFLSKKGVPNMSLVADIHTVCSCLKDFLISLKEPLATYALWSKFVKAAENEDQTTRQAELYQTFTELPQANRDTLAFLLLHLQNVAQMPNTSMTIKSLSDIFGPTIIGQSRPDLTAYQAVLEAQQSCHVLQALLEIPSDYWNSFFNTQETHSNVTTPREQCGYLYSPMSSGRYTVRRKK